MWKKPDIKKHECVCAIWHQWGTNRLYRGSNKQCWIFIDHVITVTHIIGTYYMSSLYTRWCNSHARTHAHTRTQTHTYTRAHTHTRTELDSTNNSETTTTTKKVKQQQQKRYYKHKQCYQWSVRVRQPRGTVHTGETRPSLWRPIFYSPV